MPNGHGGGPVMSPLARVLAIFHAPTKVFGDVDRGSPWWEPWIAVSLINMITAYLIIPINIRLFELNPQGFSAEDVSRGLESMQALHMKYLGVYTAPFSVLFAAMVFSSVSYVVVGVLSDRPDFKKHLTVYLYSSVIVSMGILLSNLIVRWNGVENIQSIGDAVAPLGPAAFVQPGQKIWFAVLSTLDVFSVWSYVLFGLGVMYVFDLTRRGALLTVLPYWLLAVLIALVGARLGGAP
ncbi:MAG: YIP1 family protein [Candidatus Latescibacterota bacterium]|nr:MAG: YIP1 family protein [Candidatus Latescibacterota bacterium]